MRVRDRSARVWLVGTALVAAACAGGAASTKPVATMSSSPIAASYFEGIRGAWLAESRANPGKMRTRLEQFVAQYPKDGLVPLAHVLLALVELAQNDLASADHELGQGRTLPPGATRDLWTVAQARRLRLAKDPAAALELLRPLVGKAVDPLTRAEYPEELTRAALGTNDDFEAISYMDAWLRGSTDEDKEAAVATVTTIVAELPKDVLVRSLETMRAQRATLGYGADIERILAARLVQIATLSGDAELARILLDPDAGTVAIAGDAGLVLGELATSRRGLNVVEGRTIGLLLPTESPGLRDEAADVLRGVMWALGMPRGVRTLGATGAAAPAATSKERTVRPQCGELEAAPSLDEPSAAEQVRLVTRDDAGSADRTEVSLDELAGEGAAVVIAALDGQTAARALAWGEAHAVTVVALVPPAAAPGRRSFGFVLGEARDEVVAALARAAPALGTEPVVPVVDESEVGAQAAGGAPAGSLKLLPAVSCDVAPARAGDPRFPLPAWEHSRAHAWLVSGSPACARDLVGELSASHARGLVALTLEAAALPAHGGGMRVLSASAGVVPVSAAGDLRDDELRRFAATLGNVSWWTALGRDAATLARIAVRQLPLETATAPRDVADRRARARSLLEGSRARLWTTESTGWTADHGVKRTICAVDGPAK
jgi:hypothetical protein